MTAVAWIAAGVAVGLFLVVVLVWSEDRRKAERIAGLRSDLDESRSEVGTLLKAQEESDIQLERAHRQLEEARQPRPAGNVAALAALVDAQDEVLAQIRDVCRRFVGKNAEQGRRRVLALCDEARPQDPPQDPQ